MPSATPRAVTQEELEAGDGTPGLTRKIAFETDNNVLAQIEVEGGASTAWHHHADRHVYAHLIEGAAVVEYGPGGGEELALEAGGSFHLPPRVVHRDVNPVDAPQRWIISFVGSGPLVENVDGPDPG